MEDVLHRCREKLSPLAEEYYSDLLESTSPPVSVAMPGSSEASSSSLHSSVLSRQTSVQGKSPVVHDSVCQTSPRSSIETTVSQPITHVTSPHKVDYCRVLRHRTFRLIQYRWLFALRIEKSLHHTVASPYLTCEDALSLLEPLITTS